MRFFWRSGGAADANASARPANDTAAAAAVPPWSVRRQSRWPGSARRIYGVLETDAETGRDTHPARLRLRSATAAVRQTEAGRYADDAASRERMIPLRGA